MLSANTMKFIPQKFLHLYKYGKFYKRLLDRLKEIKDEAFFKIPYSGFYEVELFHKWNSNCHSKNASLTSLLSEQLCKKF